MALPSQTKFIVGNEACERFSFYGMRSVLMLYMTNELFLSKETAVGVSHLFLACIYLLPILGGWLADQLMGRYKCILYISLFYCLGHGILAATDLTSSLEMRRIILFSGLAIIAIGAGGIKPCVSAFVGDQMVGQSKQNMTRMYAAFYWSINLGSFFAFLIIPLIRANFGYAWAFGVPGIFMGLATFVFYLGHKRYVHIAPAQPQFISSLLHRLTRGKQAATERFGEATVQRTSDTAKGILRAMVAIPILSLLGYLSYTTGSALALQMGAPESVAKLSAVMLTFIYIVFISLLGLRLAAKKAQSGFAGTAGCMLFDKAKLASQYSESERISARNMIRVLIVFLMIIPFWSLFDQTMSTWIVQGEKMQGMVLHLDWISPGFIFQFGAEEMQSVNPLFVMMLIPTITLLVYPHIGRWGSPLRRMGTGIILAGVSYMSVAYLQTRIDAGIKEGYQLSILWQVIPYALLTVSEILVSTTGLEYAYTAAGKKLKSTVTSFWYLTSTTGNILVVVLTSIVTDAASTGTFLLYGSLAMIVGCIFLYVATRPKFQAEEEIEADDPALA